MKNVVIIGAGGHGREVAEILSQQSSSSEPIRVLGFIDENPRLHGSLVNDLPVLGSWEWFEKSKNTMVVCGVGGPKIAYQLIQKARSLKLSFFNVISPLAYISRRSQIGEGVVIFPYAFVSANTFVDNYALLNVACTISHDSIIGEYANINPGAHLAGNVEIGSGAYIGMGANIIQGCKIGHWSVIGAGAVVTKSLPANVTAVGIPAKIIKNH